MNFTSVVFDVALDKENLGDIAEHGTESSYFYLSRLLPSNQGDYNGRASYAQECSSYRFTRGIRTGCHLKTNVKDQVHISIQRRQNGKVVWNTFRKYLNHNGM